MTRTLIAYFYRYGIEYCARLWHEGVVVVSRTDGQRIPGERWESGKQIGVSNRLKKFAKSALIKRFGRFAVEQHSLGDKDEEDAHANLLHRIQEPHQ